MRDWELIVDKTREACRSWQTLTFPPRAVVYFKIVGTFNTANEVIRVVGRIFNTANEVIRIGNMIQCEKLILKLTVPMKVFLH